MYLPRFLFSSGRSSIVLLSFFFIQARPSQTTVFFNSIDAGRFLVNNYMKYYAPNELAGMVVCAREEVMVCLLFFPFLVYSFCGSVAMCPLNFIIRVSVLHYVLEEIRLRNRVSIFWVGLTHHALKDPAI